MANRVGVASFNKKKVDFCPCCGQTTEIEPYPLCVGSKQLGDIGTGFPLYFRFVLFCIVILAIYCWPGYYAIKANWDGHFCTLINTANNADYPCQNTSIIQQSASSNRDRIVDYFSKDDEPDSKVGYMNLYASIIIMVCMLFFRNQLLNLEVVIDEEHCTAADYTIQVVNIPKDQTENQIKEFFSAYGQVCRVVPAYYLGDYIQQQRKKTHLEKKKTKLLQTGGQGGVLETELQALNVDISNCENQLKLISQDFDTNMHKRFTGTAFVTFQTEQQVAKVLDIWRMGWFTYWFLACFMSSKKYHNNVILVVQAPEPTDVIWENIGHSKTAVLTMRFLTMVYTIVALGGCFVVIFLISIWQNHLRDTQMVKSNIDLTITNDTGNYVLSVLASLLIFFINGSLRFIITKFAAIEHHISFTSYHVSVAIKIGLAQFFNTAIIIYIVNYNRNGYWVWTSGGLNSDAFIVLFINAYILPFASILDISYFLKLLKRRSIKRQGDACVVPQYLANQLFEGPPFNPSSHYANVIKTMLLTALYAPLLPICLIFGISNLVIQYWMEKYFLLRRYNKPLYLGPFLSHAMVDFFLEFILFTYAVGAIIQEKIIYKNASKGSIILIIISALYFILPVDKIFMNNCKNLFGGKCLRATKVLSSLNFSDMQFTLLADYDRSNPATSNKALEKWIQYLEEQEKKMEKQTGVNQIQINLIRDMASKMKGQASQRNFALNSYAQSNQGLQTLYQSQPNNFLSFIGINPMMHQVNPYTSRFINNPPQQQQQMQMGMGAANMYVQPQYENVYNSQTLFNNVQNILNSTVQLNPNQLRHQQQLYGIQQPLLQQYIQQQVPQQQFNQFPMMEQQQPLQQQNFNQVLPVMDQYYQQQQQPQPQIYQQQQFNPQQQQQQPQLYQQQQFSENPFQTQTNPFQQTQHIQNTFESQQHQQGPQQTQQAAQGSIQGVDPLSAMNQLKARLQNQN